MKRGEVWTAAAGRGYAGKPRPVVIVQDDAFGALPSVTVCGLTTDPADTPILRLPVEPSETNGLRAPSKLMVDKLSTVPREKLGTRVGRLADADMVRLERALIVFLGLATPASARG